MKYLAPPLGGALIGYVTNYIAIRMLFRPLRPWRVLGMRVPLTPGIIPARRAELAGNIGRMVGQHLLTRDEILEALERPAFRESLEKAIGSFMGRLWAFDLGRLRQAGGAWREGGALLASSIGDAVGEALKEPSVRERIRDSFANIYDRAIGRSLDELLPGADQKADTLARDLLGFLSSEAMRERLSRSAEEFLFGRIASADRLLNLVPEEMYQLFKETVGEEVPALLERLSSLLEDDDVRRRMTGALRSAVDESIRNAGLVARVFRLFLGDENLEERLEATVERVRAEAIVWLREPGTAERVTEVLWARIDRIAGGDLKMLLERIPSDRVDAVRRFGRQQLFSVLGSTVLSDGIRNVLRVELAGRSAVPLRDLINEFGGDDAAEGSRDVVVESVMRFVGSERGLEELSGIAKDFVAHLTEQMLTGTLGNRLSPDLRRELERLSMEQARDLLAREVPELVDSLDVEGIVETRVNRLDILRVEEMIEGIMREQFGYINVFGAILGFLIGAVNLLWLR